MPGPAPADRPLPAHARVVVVGAGFSGVAAAVALERSGEHDVVLLEQADEVGGTWRDNAYPGCACDVPSHLYQLSYAPNPDWSHSFARQPEIQRYLVDVSRRLGVRDEGAVRHRARAGGLGRRGRAVARSPRRAGR